MSVGDTDWAQAVALLQLTPSERVERAQHVARQVQMMREAGRLRDLDARIRTDAVKLV